LPTIGDHFRANVVKGDTSEVIVFHEEICRLETTYR